MSNEPGLTYRGKFYPRPKKFRLGDIVLITEITGLEFIEFAQALDDDGRNEDPVIVTGLIATSVWQQNPLWTRVRAVQFVQNMVWEEIEFFSGLESEETDGPPTGADEAAGLSASPATSTPSPEPQPVA